MSGTPEQSAQEDPGEAARDTAALPDAAARAAALDPARSFIVQAPAGSGKTELLVRRYTALLGAVTRPEEVLAITFTRKAAAEMKKRVLQRLGSGMADLAPRLRIMTIDALCMALTRQLPLLANFGAQPATADADEAAELYAEAASRTLGLLEAGDPHAGHAAQLLTHLDNDVGAVVRLLSGMLARRDQWLRHAGNPPTRAELEAAFQAERERRLGEASALHPKASAELAEKVLTRKGEWRKKPAAPEDMVGNEPLRLALFALLQQPPAHYGDGQWQVLASMLELLKLAAAQLKLLFAERGVADFTEFAQAAVHALGSADNPSELLLRMDAGIRHILVDEFQDTSQSQWELLEHLTAGWEPGDGRTVFAVGDPMQSIYRFREAEVGLFLRARRAGLGTVHLEALALQTNFRSQAGLVDWFNRSFARILPRHEDEAAGAVPYSPAAAHPRNPALAGAAAQWHGFSGDGNRNDEARRVMQLVQSARAEFPDGTCAVLVRNRVALIDVVPALEAAGLRYRAVEIEALAETQVVQDLYALARALAHPADRVAWLALLRSRACGLTLADLHLLAGLDDTEAAASEAPTLWECLHDEHRLAALSADSRARAESLCGVLAPALAGRLRGSLRERVEGVWLALGGPACLDSRTELEDAGIFFDQLDRLDDAGDVADDATLQASLARLYALPDLDADEHDVQIMTIHKAKGLEFDTVIVPGLDRAPRHSERPLLARKWQAGGRLLLAPINAAGNDKEPLFSYVRAEIRRAEDTEAARLLYVAATRARSRLHLLGCVKVEPAHDHFPPGVRAPAARSLLDCAWPVAAPDFRATLGTATAAATAAAVDTPPARTPTAPLLRLPADWRRPAAPPAAAWTVAADSPVAAEQIEFSWVGEKARHVGSVAHRWLQRLADDELHDWDRARVDRLRPALRTALAARGVEEGELKSAAERVMAALQNAIEDERGRWLLGPQTLARNEYRLTARVDGRRRSMVIDRTFVADGRRWIVDYKTSSHEGTDVAAFLDREEERYRRQLLAYGRHLPESDPVARQARALLGLYFPLLRGWRQLGDNQDDAGNPGDNADEASENPATP